MGEDNGVEGIPELVVDLEFLDLDGLFSLLDEVALLLLPHLAQPVFLDILNVLHVDEHDFFDVQGVRVDDREVKVLDNVLPMVDLDIVVIINLQVVNEVNHWILQGFDCEVDFIYYVAVQEVAKKVCPVFKTLHWRVKFEYLSVFKEDLNLIGGRDQALSLIHGQPKWLFRGYMQFFSKDVEN